MSCETQVFVNEHSIHEQYETARQFENAVVLLRQILKSAKSEKVEKIYVDKTRIIGRRPIKGVYFLPCLSTCDRALSSNFKEVLFGNLDWRNERAHSVVDSYRVDGQEVADSSMAELAERILSNGKLFGIIVNFLNSRYAGLDLIKVIKNDYSPAPIDCVDSPKRIKQRLATIDSKRAKYEYDYASTSVPEDEQTCLVDESRFIKTKLFEQGRKIFEEIGTGRFWYADNASFGKNAHLEVCDGKGQHIGIADLDGRRIDGTKTVPGRTIKL